MKSIVIKQTTFSEQKLFVKNNKVIIFILSVTLIGVCLGATLFKLTTNSALSEITDMIESYLSEGKSLSFLKLFTRSLINDYIYLLVIFVSGVCALGLPVVIAVPLVKGISTGAIIAYLYTTGGLKGFVYFAIILAIPTTLTILLLVFASKEAFDMSLNISLYVFSDGVSTKVKQLKVYVYIKRFVIICIALIITSGLDAVITSLFSTVL